ncbi:AT-rich interactive domain-containing protein 6-like [Populus alba x Populus x berolinensis]|uniref:ARID/BRIGHT DNA-binding domain-containing protein n=3 Tax=Populus TaxID=3689 RepID=A0A8X8DLN8_POPTO|nr:AT-rich interactive domain-containing protein 6-like [Populus alba]KAG6794166.1 hypothetical protein POTOM_003401 [Populus tomentosa]KAJ6967010.1 AT-rich interactive domain-containing protein 6-like [Populus alba x Populus x berolinensis]
MLYVLCVESEMSNNKDNEVGSAREVPGTLETEQLVDALEAPVEQADAVDIPLELNSCPQQPHQDSALPTPLDDKRSLVMPKVESVKDVKANGTYNLEPETCAGDGIAVSSSHVETAKPTVDAEIKPSDIQGATGHDTWAVVKRSNEPAVPQAGSSDDEAKGDNKRGSDDAKNNIDTPSPKSNGNSTPRRTFLLDENSGGSESGTEEEQNDFLSELHSFFSEKSMEFKPPKFYGDLLNCLKLWRSVMRLGGYDKVTSCKLWRQVGESFNPPKTCTTISWTFRGFYEKVLLDYERHITNAGEPDIPVASKSEPKQLKPPKLSRSEPVHVDNQASGSGRTRRDAAARAMQGWHSLRFLGNGEVSSPIIKDKNTVPVQKREKELKNIGLLKRKKPSYVEHAVKSPRTKSARLDVEVTDIGAPADWVKINVQKTKDSFDVYALVPGLLREEVRVQSDPAGRLVISGEPEHEDNPWGVAPFKKVVNLPSRIDPHQTTAVVTLHGQLYVRVPFEESD